MTCCVLLHRPLADKLKKKLVIYILTNIYEQGEMTKKVPRIESFFVKLTNLKGKSMDTTT